MSLQQLFTSRKNYDASTFVAGDGKLFYDEDLGYLRLGDGSTPGGKVISNLALAAVSVTAPINPYPGELWYNPTTKELWAYHNGQFRGTINAATSSTIGGIKAGPGVVVSSDGSLSLDSTGIPFSFGDFYAFVNTGTSNGACLSSINLNQDINIVSNGSGSINIVGKFEIHRTNGDLEAALTSDPIFSISSDGDINATTLDIKETADLGTQAPLNVTINQLGLTKTPLVVTGSVAQFTGRDARSPLIILDSYGVDASRNLTGGEFVFRTGRGTNSTTTSVLSGDRLGEITAAGWASNGYGGIGVGGIRILAAENFTPTARGSKLELYVVPNGTLTTTTIATVIGSGIQMSAGKTLIGNVTGTASTATNLSTATDIVAGTLIVDPANIVKNTVSVQTFALPGMTTAHKVVVTLATSLGYGILISAAWVAAPNTLSIEFQNFGNSDIDSTPKNISYFAWI